MPQSDKIPSQVGKRTAWRWGEIAAFLRGFELTK